MKHDLNTLVQYIKDYANFHYEDGGWDVIAECWDDKDILKILTDDKVTTEKEALAAFTVIVAVWEDRLADAAEHRREAIGDGEDRFTSWRGDSDGSVGVD
jgi:hypothetical protein